MSKICRDKGIKHLGSYIENIEKIKDLIIKNFEDMDFENCNRKDEMEDIVSEISNMCATEVEKIINVQKRLEY